jgi:hypothetical protein|tara:strand:- start:56 stop:337 length:282 start_codon:yes stop_codon:yes gene_type:complete
VIWTRVLELQQKLGHKTSIPHWQGTAEFGSKHIASQSLSQKNKESKMANKRGRPKKTVYTPRVVEGENKILSFIKKLIGTKKRKTFWDWLTSK